MARFFGAAGDERPSVLAVAALQAQDADALKNEVPLSKVAQQAALQVENEPPAREKSFSQSELEILQNLPNGAKNWISANALWNRKSAF